VATEDNVKRIVRVLNIGDIHYDYALVILQICRPIIHIRNAFESWLQRYLWC